jgi:hypothetical protein
MTKFLRKLYVAFDWIAGGAKKRKATLASVASCHDERQSQARRPEIRNWHFFPPLWRGSAKFRGWWNAGRERLCAELLDISFSAMLCRRGTRRRGDNDVDGKTILGLWPPLRFSLRLSVFEHLRNIHLDYPERSESESSEQYIVFAGDMSHYTC